MKYTEELKNLERNSSPVLVVQSAMLCLIRKVNKLGYKSYRFSDKMVKYDVLTRLTITEENVADLREKGFTVTYETQWVTINPGFFRRNQKILMAEHILVEWE